MDASTVLSCGFDILKTYSGEFELIVVEYPAGPMIVVLGEIAFHEKAGRSQVGSFVFSWDKVFSFAAE
jgi:hypothetical protein